MKTNKTLEWSPIDLYKIKSENCIYVGEIEVYTQDPHSGEVSHGQRKRHTPIYGYLNDESSLQFIASFNITDKHESLKIDGEHNIGGCVKKSGRYAKTNYKLGFTCSLLDLISQDTKNTSKMLENADISYFNGNAKMTYVPGNQLVDIQITYYLYKNYLAYVTFNLTKDQYNSWMSFKELHMNIYDNGNIINVD